MPNLINTGQMVPGGFVASATAPLNTELLWYDTSAKALKYYSGSSWVILYRLVVSSSAPSGTDWTLWGQY